MQVLEKATDLEVTEKFLVARIGSGKYGVSAWIVFCREMMGRGYRATLYEARNTVSKYVTVWGANDDFYRVRFSSHKPILCREAAGDCDFFVGVTNFGTTNTQMAVQATLKHLGDL